MVLVACVVSLGAWVLAAPAMPNAGVARVDPPVDLEPLQLASVRESAPRSVKHASAADASSVAPREEAAAGDAERPDPRCGDDQQPIVNMPAPDPADGSIHPEWPAPDPDGVLRRWPGEVKAAGTGYTGAMARLDAALRTSGDPFDRAMADWLDLNLITPPQVRQEALVSDALAVSDARVYGLAYVACQSGAELEIPGRPAAPAVATGCARLSAQTWARLDPGNAKPWLYALEQADKVGDVAAQRAALDGLANSTRLDVHYLAGAAAVSRQRLRDADLAAQTNAAMKPFGLGFPPFQPLTERCRKLSGGDPALAATCNRIAATFYDHSDSYIGRAIGGSVHKLITGDPAWIDRARQQERERQSSLLEPAASGAPCSAHRAMLAHFIQQDQGGELRSAGPSRVAASR